MVREHERDGVVYLLHFSEPYEHARHYIGFTTDLAKRLKQHQRGWSGVKLTEAAAAAGVQFQVVRTWAGDRNLERRLKKRRSAFRFCPVCAAEHGRQPVQIGYATDVHIPLDVSGGHQIELSQTG